MKRNKSRNTTIASLVLILIVFALYMMLIDGDGNLGSGLEQGISVLTESDSFIPQNETGIDENNFTKAYVEYVIDGDTAWVNIDGEDYKVRFIGIDTPEIGEDLYNEASDFTRELIEEKTVYLEKDVSEVDRYDRLLRYIWLEFPTEISEKELQLKMLNAMLIKKGLAQAVVFEPDTKYAEYFNEIE